MQRCRRLLVLLALMFAVAGAPGTASAAEQRVPATALGFSAVSVGRGVPRAFAAASLAGVHLAWSGITYRLAFVAGARAQRAITDDSARLITLYVRPGQTPQLTSKIIAYELGHVLDFRCNTYATRVAWLAARGAARAHWWAPNERPETTYGSGDFADVFSLWATSSTAGWRSTVAPIPKPAQLGRLTSFFHCANANATPDVAAP